MKFYCCFTEFMNPTLQELIDKGSKLKANKPSQYFLDKTEAQLVQQTVKNIVNQSNLDYLHTKFKKAKPPVTLTASTNPSNPFS